MKKFIYTDDKESADTLVKQGFKLVGTDKRSWFFINEEAKKETLAQFNKLKMSYTNNVFFTA